MKNGRLEENKNYGICNLDMFVRKEEYYEKKNLIENESKNFKNIRTIKIEFTIYSMFLLLCKLKFFIILNKKYLYLANGKILSKGTNLLGRDFHNLKHQKIFDVVDFGNEEQEILIYDISTGKDYILALDKDYKVWGWGSNMRKQLDPKSDIKEFRKPRKLSLFDADISIVQIYALDEISIAISKDKTIKVWGEDKNEVFLKSETNNEKDKTSYVEKNTLSKYIEKELLKDDFDITQSFITSRRNFNTKYYNNETEIISSDNNQINLFEEERDINIKNKKKAINFNEKNIKNIEKLEEFIQEYDKGLEEINSKKEDLRMSLKIISDQINQIKIDQEKIVDKKNEISEKNNNNNSNNQKSLEDDIDISNSFKSTLVNKIAKIYKSNLNSALENLIEINDSKKTERDLITVEIEKLVEQENSLFENKKVLIDMKLFLENYNYNNNYTDYSQNSFYFFNLIGILKSIEENTFLSLEERYSQIDRFISTENILNESNTMIEKINEKYQYLFNSSSEDNLVNFYLIMKNIIEQKLTLVKEQNNLISYLNNLIYSIPYDITKIIKNTKNNSPNKKQNKTKSEGNEKKKILNLILRNKHEVLEISDKSFREMIVDFMKESYGIEDIMSKEDFKLKRIDHKVKNKKEVNEKLENEYLFKDRMQNLNMDDLVVMSKFNENE